VVSGQRKLGDNFPSKGAKVGRRVGRRKIVPYYDRGQIEDGALDGWHLEICWLRDPVDVLFAQIQGSARIRLEDGTILRVNYDAHNGWPYTPVGRVLIERNAIPKDQMSMARIRQWMEANPDQAKDVRRQNKSYVFFRVTGLSTEDEAIGAEGVPLVPGRSIAVDHALHVYGMPFFIQADLPIVSDKSNTKFRRLMFAQDTGSAIVGPARADLYFGAGDEAARMAGRIKNPGDFVMLLPQALDPVAAGEDTPLPPERSSAFSLNENSEMDDPTVVEVAEPESAAPATQPGPKSAAATPRRKTRPAP
jgi:membrane-bound lytic murein transglycosylase A